MTIATEIPDASPREEIRYLRGGGVKAVKGDFEFYGFAGTIKGDISKLKIEDFWYMDPLNKALDKLGRM